MELESLARRFTEKREESLDRLQDAWDELTRVQACGQKTAAAQVLHVRKMTPAARHAHFAECTALIGRASEAIEEAKMFSELAQEARRDARRALAQAEYSGVIYRGHVMPRKWFRDQRREMERGRP